MQGLLEVLFDGFGGYVHGFLICEESQADLMIEQLIIEAEKSDCTPKVTDYEYKWSPLNKNVNLVVGWDLDVMEDCFGGIVTYDQNGRKVHPQPDSNTSGSYADYLLLVTDEVFELKESQILLARYDQESLHQWVYVVNFDA